MSGKVKYHELSNEQKLKYLGDFYSIVALVKSRDDAKKFFKDLLTLSEMVMISRRIQIARMLMEGYGQEDIRKKLKTGYATINQVEKWLNNGFGGYKKIIKKFNDKNKSKIRREYPVPYSRKWIKKRYPLHYLFSNIFGI